MENLFSQEEEEEEKVPVNLKPWTKTKVIILKPLNFVSSEKVLLFMCGFSQKSQLSSTFSNPAFP